MRGRIYACVTLLACSVWPQEPEAKIKSDQARQLVRVGAALTLNEMFESKIGAEWEALKRKDKKAYGELLADDYQGVEVDGQGERSKTQAINEVAKGNVYNYTLFGFKLNTLGPDAAFVIYEATMEFPPRAQVRYSRVYVSELWTKRTGQWQELHYQETNVR